MDEYRDTPTPLIAPTNTPSSFVSLDEFLSSGTIPTEDIPVDEIAAGKKIRIKALTSLEVNKWRSKLTTTKGGRQVSRDDIDADAVLVYMGCIHPDGSRFFTSVQQVDAISRKAGTVVLRLSGAIAKLSGINQTPDELRADKENLEGI
jgi:hypothetical protein